MSNCQNGLKYRQDFFSFLTHFMLGWDLEKSLLTGGRYLEVVVKTGLTVIP